MQRKSGYISRLIYNYGMAIGIAIAKNNEQ
jgi:hypothetical protein